MTARVSISTISSYDCPPLLQCVVWCIIEGLWCFRVTWKRDHLEVSWNFSDCYFSLSSEQTTRHTGNLSAIISTENDYSQANIPSPQGFELSRESRAQADLKFTYVISCQIYGQQKQRKLAEATDIALLLQRWDSIRQYFHNLKQCVIQRSLSFNLPMLSLISFWESNADFTNLKIGLGQMVILLVFGFVYSRSILTVLNIVTQVVCSPTDSCFSKKSC